MPGATMGMAVECIPDKENIDPTTGALSPRLMSKLKHKRVALQDITLLMLPKKQRTFGTVISTAEIKPKITKTKVKTSYEVPLFGMRDCR